VSVAKVGPAEDQKVESADLTGARGELVEALLREPRGAGAHRPEGVPTVELLQPGAGRARPRDRLPTLGPAGSRRFPVVPVAGMALGACALVALAAAVWPRLGYGGEGEITYFGHVARFEGLEELIAGLDKVAPRYQSQSDHSSEATARAQQDNLR
jgi:hypothetical protein